MSVSSESAELFDWLTDDQLKELVVKLNSLPSGKEFERRIEEEMQAVIGCEKRTYEEIVEDHGDLIGYVDENETLLPWWLRDFDWTVISDPIESLTIKEDTLDEFEQYPLDSTRIDKISLTGVESLINGLDAFVSIEEQLSSTLNIEVSTIAQTVDADPENFTLPDKLFVIPESGRIATSDSFEEWFERTLNLCPPAAPELTALFRINTNIKRQHAKEALDEEQIQRLTELSVFDSSDADTSAYNEQYVESLATLLQIRPPFDLEIDLNNDKDSLTELQYIYYQQWAKHTPRMSNEQQWIRAAKNTKSLSEGESYRFAEYAFRMPVQLNSDSVVFEDQEKYGSSNERSMIVSVLEEHGHPANDD